MNYVIKNSKQLGLDEQWFSQTKRKRTTSAHPYWYVVSKETGEVVENSRFMERKFAKNLADRLNSSQIRD